MSIQKKIMLPVFILGCELVGMFGGLLTAPAIPSWYAGLVKPFLQPPNWIFGPAWTLLYALMGFAVWIVWMQPKSQARTRALRLFWIQLVLNAIWTPIFFGLQQIGLAALVIVGLLVALVLTIKQFFARSRQAGWLLVPYLAWVIFASYLNIALWVLN